MPPEPKHGLATERSSPLRLNAVYFLRHFTSGDSLGDCLEGAVPLGTLTLTLTLAQP